MTLAVTVGSRLPAHATSKGRVLLAFLPEAELEAYFARSAIARYTDKTVVDESELRGILADVRRLGWSIVDQRLEEGLCSVAAPVTDASGRVGAALSVCAHAGRVDPATLRGEFLPLVLRPPVGSAPSGAVTDDRPRRQRRAPAPAVRRRRCRRTKGSRPEDVGRPDRHRGELGDHIVDVGRTRERAPKVAHAP